MIDAISNDVKSLEKTGIEMIYAKRDELYEIAEFLDLCWRDVYCNMIDHDFFDEMSAAKRYEALCSRFDEGSSKFMIVQVSGEMIGTAVFGKSFTEGFMNDGEISAIYFKHDYVGKGYGHIFLSRIEAELALLGYKNFVIDVLSDNSRAVSFYKAHGYKEVGNQKVQLGVAEYSLKVFRKEN